MKPFSCCLELPVYYNINDSLIIVHNQGHQTSQCHHAMALVVFALPWIGHNRPQALSEPEPIQLFGLPL